MILTEVLKVRGVLGQPVVWKRRKNVYYVYVGEKCMAKHLGAISSLRFFHSCIQSLKKLEEEYGM